MSTDMTPPAAPTGETTTINETAPVIDAAPFMETAPVIDAASFDAADPQPPAAVTASPAPLIDHAAPRVRGAAIIWGLLFAAIAFAGIWMLTDDERRSATADAITTLTPGTATAVVLLAVGVLVLVTGAVGLIRHAQRRSASGG